MAWVISFRTNRFDVSNETPNPINPIAGERVLNWLREQLLTAGYKVTAPDSEDWGWYIEAERGGVSYLVGASADMDDVASDVEWTVQVHLNRSMAQRLLGKSKLAAGDALVTLIENTVRADSSIGQVSVTRDSP